MRPLPIVDAVSSYGLMAGSPRVRLDDWFSHEQITAHWHTYAGTRDVRPTTMLRHAPAVLAAEVRLRRARPTGILTLSREASPWSLGGVEANLLRRAARGVYDVDDAIYDDPSPIRKLMRFDRKWKKMLAAADVVIAGNDYLADRASQDAADVRVIPSCVEPDDYVTKTDWSIDGPARVVWLGSPATEHFLVPLMDSLTWLHDRTGARLVLISGPDENPSLAPIASLTDRVPWRPGTVATALASGDVAIGPLDDSLYARGKCAYKLLQYAASALPMVASPVGANATALQRFDGIAVDRPEDWADALAGIIEESSDRRAERGRTAALAVADHYSFDTWSGQWRNAVFGEQHLVPPEGARQ